LIHTHLVFTRLPYNYTTTSKTTPRVANRKRRSQARLEGESARLQIHQALIVFNRLPKSTSDGVEAGFGPKMPQIYRGGLQIFPPILGFCWAGEASTNHKQHFQTGLLADL
jgi:hypothetical protein